MCFSHLSVEKFLKGLDLQPKQGTRWIQYHILLPDPEKKIEIFIIFIKENFIFVTNVRC